MNYIGIDASLISTAVCVQTGKEQKFFNFTTIDKLSKWMRAIEPVTSFTTIPLITPPKTFSDSEIYKLQRSRQAAFEIVQLIKKYLPAKIVIEGYSYSSAAGPIIDLVTFGSHLRWLLLENCSYTILTPTQLKSKSCELAYGLDKKGIPRNDEGIAGGKFKKREMVKAMLDWKPDSGICPYISEFKDELLGLKNIPKPLDDICDAWWAMEVSKVL